MLDAKTTALIQELPTAKLGRLRELWEEHFGRAASPQLRPKLMRPILAYRIQEQAYGGLKAQTVRQLSAVLRGIAPNRREGNEASSRFKAGTRIVREWKGETHEVTITVAGYEYDGQLYRSLSPIACRITGTRWSGPAFFGTRKGDRR